METAKSTTHKTVCVISAPQLQNEFICRRLEEQVDVNCFTAKGLDEARVFLGEDYDRVNLLLWDSWGKDLAGVIEDVRDAEGLLPKDSIVGLFNVQRKGWRNNMTLPPHVKGAFLVGVSVEEFVRGASCMLEGKPWLPVDKGEVPGGGPQSEPLTPTEKTILSLIKQGKSNQEIADALGAKYNTIKNHCSNLFRKLNVSNRRQAALRTRNHAS